jgi:hypothetical protein
VSLKLQFAVMAWKSLYKANCNFWLTHGHEPARIGVCAGAWFFAEPFFYTIGKILAFLRGRAGGGVVRARAVYVRLGSRHSDARQLPCNADSAPVPQYVLSPC